MGSREHQVFVLWRARQLWRVWPDDAADQSPAATHDDRHKYFQLRIGLLLLAHHRREQDHVAERIAPRLVHDAGLVPGWPVFLDAGVALGLEEPCQRRVNLTQLIRQR